MQKPRSNQLRQVRFAETTSGIYAALALDSSGDLWFRGSNAHNHSGDSGDGTGFIGTWTLVTQDVKDFAVMKHSPAGGAICVKTDGTAFAWGGDSDQRAGVGSADVTQIDGLLDCDTCHYSSLTGWFQKTNGELWCFNDVPGGSAGGAHLGDGADTRHLAPAVHPTFSNLVPAQVTLQTILEGIADHTGLASGDRDFSAASGDGYCGYLVTNRREAKQHMAQASDPLGYDLVEIDGQIKVTKRNGASLTTLSADDLGVEFWRGNSPTNRLSTDVVPEHELPTRVDVAYFNFPLTESDKPYQQALQTSIRYGKPGNENQSSLFIPGVLLDDQARQIGEYKLYQLWAERDRFMFQTTMEFFEYAPGDVLTVPVDGVNTEMRIIRQTLAPLGPMRHELVRHVPEVLDQTIGGGATGEYTHGGNTSLETVAFAKTMNALKDAHTDGIGIYLGATGPSGWQGCIVHASYDGGTTYQVLEEILDKAAMGTASSILADGDQAGAWDDVNTVDVTLVHGGTVETVSDSEVYSGANVMLIGNEVIQFATVELLGGSSYRLSRLLRGQRGTVMTGHVASEQAVLLDEGSIKYVPLDLSLFGKSIDLKFVTIGTLLADATNVNYAVTGDEFKSYCPVEVAASRDGSDNMTITWDRRTRCEGQWTDLITPPLCEDSENYEVDILASPGGAVLRTILVTAETASYTAAEQTTDGLTPGDVVDLEVFQIGRYTRGYDRAATV